MRPIKYIFIFIFFVTSGEIIFRLDEVIRGSNHISEEKTNIDYGTEPINCKRNIFLIGDSYTAGQGIPIGYRISDLIKFQDYCLINRTKGGDDWLDYYQKYQKIFKECNNGDIVIIGVNWNDILYSDIEYQNKDNFDMIKQNSLTITDKQTLPKKNKPWYRYLYTSSKLVNTLSSNIQNTLKRHNLALVSSSNKCIFFK
jgi:hypothetical protein